MQTNTNPNAPHSQQSNKHLHVQHHVNPAKQLQRGEILHQQQQQHTLPPQQQQHMLPPQQQQQDEHQSLLQQQHMLPPQQQQQDEHQSLLQQGFQQQMYAPNVWQLDRLSEYSYQQGQTFTSQQGYQHHFYPHREEYPQDYVSSLSQQTGQQGYICTQGNELQSGPDDSHDQGAAMSMNGTSMTPQTMQQIPYRQSQYLEPINYQAQTAGEYQGMIPSHCSGKNEEGSQLKGEDSAVKEVHGQSHSSVLPALQSDFHDSTQQLRFIDNTHTHQHQDLAVDPYSLQANPPIHSTPNISSQQRHQLDISFSFGQPSTQFLKNPQLPSQQRHQQIYAKGYMPLTHQQQEVQGYTQDFVSLTASTGGHAQGRDMSVEYGDGSKTAPCHTQQHQHVQSQLQDSTNYHPTQAPHQRALQSHIDFPDTETPVSQQGALQGHLKTGFISQQESPHEQNFEESIQQITSTKIMHKHQHHNMPTSTQIPITIPKANVQVQPPSNIQSSTKALVLPHGHSKGPHISFQQDLDKMFQHQQYHQHFPDSRQWSNYPEQYQQTSSMYLSGHYGTYAPYSSPLNPEAQQSSGPQSANQGYPSHDSHGEANAEDHYQHSRSEVYTDSSGRQSFVYGMLQPAKQTEEDEYRLHLMNLGPEIFEDTLENFLETCAEAEVEGFEWATNKESVVVTFKIKPDVSAVITACQKKPLEGHYIKVTTLPKSRCLKVTGLSPGYTEDSVQYYFENKEGGGPIEDLQLLQQPAFVQFEHYGVAEKVLNCLPHTMCGCPSQVCIQPEHNGYMVTSDEGDTQMTVTHVSAGKTPETAVEVDEMKILVMNLTAKTSEDTLRNFLESKADADVSVVEWGRNKTSAVVSFESKPDIEALKKGCETRKVDRQKVEIRNVNRSKCVKVTGLSSDTTEDSIHCYFETKKRGGPVNEVELFQETNTAIVRFEDYGVAEKVCTSSYKFCGHNLTVVMHTDTPGFVPTGIPGNEEGELAGTNSQMTPEHPDDSIDSLKILVKGINPETSEESIRNFLEAKADADIDDLQWAEDRTEAIVTFRSETDVKTLTKKCEGRKVDGHKIEIQAVKKSKCVKVTGLSPDTTEESVLYYFENKKRGGSVDNVELYQDTNTAIVRFKRYGVAEKVCTSSYKFYGHNLTVVMHTDTPGFVPTGIPGNEEGELAGTNSQMTPEHPDDSIDSLKISVKGINPETSEESIRNFLEAKADADIDDLQWAEDRTEAIVTFRSETDVKTLTKKCEGRKVDGHTIEIQAVKKFKCVKVTGLSPDTTEDSVRYYFENKKRGGSVDNVELYQEANTAIVRFKRYGVAEKICTSSHKFCGHNLTVVMHTDTPGFVPTGIPGNEEGELAGTNSQMTPEHPDDNIDSLKISVKGINPETSEESIRNFLEARADADIDDLQWAEDRTEAIVTFRSETDVKTLTKKCEGRKVDGHTIEIRAVKKSKCVKVTGLSPDTTEDSVRYYFENKKRGGSVDNVELYQEANTAIVRFKQCGVAEKVCTSSHKFGGHNLTVVMHTDTPGFVPTGIPGSEECELAGTNSQMTPEHPDDSIDSLKISVKGINPETSEESMRNFLEAKADADIDDLQRAEDITEDSVRYYFENKKRGGPVDNVELYQEASTDTARFKRYGVAEMGCSLSHTLLSQSVSVQKHMDVPGFASLGQTGTQTQRTEKDLSESYQLVVKCINPVTSEDTLRNFLEDKAHADVDAIRWGKGRTAAVVTFNTEPDIDKLKTACTTRQVHLIVESVSRSRSLKVAGLSGTSTEGSLLYYFENTKRSGGGPIEQIQLLHDCDTALIQFEEVGVAERVCSRKHTLADKDVSVVVLQDIPGFVSADDDSEENEELFNNKHEWHHILSASKLGLNVADFQPSKRRYHFAEGWLNRAETDRF